MIGITKGCLFICGITLALWTPQTTAINLNHLQQLPAYEDFASKDFLENDPNYLLELLSQIRAQMPHHNMDISKRGGIDFGLGRGFSGAEAAKIFRGLAAANYGGPGRKKRSS